MKNRASLVVAALLVLLVASCSKHSSPAPKTAAAADPGDWMWEANSQTLDRVPPIMLLRPTTLPAIYVPFDMFGKDRYLARGKTLKELIAAVWSQKNSRLKIKFDADLPEGKFDFIVAGQSHWWDQLQSEIDQRFHLIERVEPGDKIVVGNSDIPREPLRP
jgi:hypothetical protein